VKRENGFAVGFAFLRPLRNSLGNPDVLRPGAENHPANCCGLVMLGAVISACVYLAVCLCPVISKTSPIFAAVLAAPTPGSSAGRAAASPTSRAPEHASCPAASRQLRFGARASAAWISAGLFVSKVCFIWPSYVKHAIAVCGEEVISVLGADIGTQR